MRHDQTGMFRASRTVLPSRTSCNVFTSRNNHYVTTTLLVPKIIGNQESEKKSLVAYRRILAKTMFKATNSLENNHEPLFGTGYISKHPSLFYIRSLLKILNFPTVSKGKECQKADLGDPKTDMRWVGFREVWYFLFPLFDEKTVSNTDLRGLHFERVSRLNKYSWHPFVNN